MPRARPLYLCVYCLSVKSRITSYRLLRDDYDLCNPCAARLQSVERFLYEEGLHIGYKHGTEVLGHPDFAHKEQEGGETTEGG